MPRRVGNKRRGNIKRKFRKFRRSSRKFMNDGKRFFKLKANFSIDSDSVGRILITVAASPTGFSDWTNISALFDSYRICASKVKFIPALPNDSSSSVTFAPMYVIADNDSGTNPLTTTVSDAIQYENCKIKNMFRPWTYYRKWPKLTAQASGGTMLQGGYQDVASVSANQGIYGIGTGYTVSKNYGNMIITHYIAAKNRR